jgi:alkyl hydroperoxide reductase subunit AhpC
LTCRAALVVDPDKRLKLSVLHPASTGRNFDDTIRAIDSPQLTAGRRPATPGNWAHRGECCIASVVSDADAAKLFPGH